jgi:hypothetical protein
VRQTVGRSGRAQADLRAGVGELRPHLLDHLLQQLALAGLTRGSLPALSGSPPSSSDSLPFLGGVSSRGSGARGPALLE